jgi:hypothetical protein
MRALPFALACVALTLAACGSTRPPGGYGSGEYRQPAVVPAPGSAPPPAPGARVLSFVCEDLTKVTFVEGQPNARATLNSGLELGLNRTGANRYGAGAYDFRVMTASDAQWINQGKVWRCRVG